LLPQRWIMLAILFLVRLAMGYQFQSIASVSSQLVAEFGFSYAEVGTLIGFFLLPGIIVAIPSGLLTRSMADKNLLMIGAVAMIVGAMIIGFGSTPTAIYSGRLVTGIGGTIFNVILTKMVTEWFFEKEIMTALGVMLTAWPIGIALGLVTQGAIAEDFGWQAVMHATAIVAFVALVLTATAYRDAPTDGAAEATPLKLGLPWREFVHVTVVGVAWAMFNAALIVAVSFAPDALVAHGHGPASARFSTSLFMWVSLISLPLGGRLMDVIGHVTLLIVASMSLAMAAMVSIVFGLFPEWSFVAFGLFFGIPGGALLALSAEAVSPDNRGAGLGIFYTWYYVGMTVAPPIAGWSRDLTGEPAAPLVISIAMLATVVVAVAALRLLQALWPIRVDQAASGGVA
jgi:MFS family permease